MNKVWKTATMMLLAVGLAAGTVACEEKKDDKEGEKKESKEEPKEEEDVEEEEEEEPEAWAEMDAFHEYMAGTFHPSENGDLAPLKEKARAMADAAKAWKESEIPASYQKDGVTETLEKLATESDALAVKVEGGKASDKELTADINALHERFHEIVERCYHEEGDHDHDHDHEDHKH